MKTKSLLVFLLLLLLTVLPVSSHADTFVIDFSDIRQEIDASSDDPDAVVRAYLAGLIRSELDAQGFNVDAGLVFGEIPVDEITEIIATDCNYPKPYAVHTDATTATVTLDDTSSFTIAIDNIRSIEILANLTGIIETDTTAWVRWGQDVPFIGDCKTINTDHGWVGLIQPLTLDLSLSLDLTPTYDPDQVAIVVDKHALLAGQAQFNGGILQHDFGTASLTDVVLDVFEDELLATLNSNGVQAVADAIVTLNYRMDGLDENGVPDPAIEAFNGPTAFVLNVDPDDQDFINGLLAELGIPELVLEMVDERGVEILLQLAILEGDEREAYLAGLGATVGCDALFANYKIPLDIVPTYTLNGSNCELADFSMPGGGSYFSDMLCSNEIAFTPTDEVEFCLAQFGDQSETLLGNAASWAPDTNQPGDELPAIESRSWTSLPSTLLDVGVVSLQGNHQPYIKQLNYKTILNVPRGNGSCELEMRVYKSDITEQGLKPLIAFHGGTWQTRGSSFLGLEAGISHFTERGFIVFAPFYRLVGEKDGNVECNGVGWREVTDDAESALDWVIQNGTALGAVQEPVSVYGQSAGAHLAAWLAARFSNDVRKALLYYGPVDALDFLADAVPIGGPLASFRGFGLRSLTSFYGAQNSTAEIHLEQINFAGLTVSMLSDNWSTLIPSTVFDLSQIDPLVPPIYLARCAATTQTDLAAINLAMPPAELTDCMKQDLSEFLINNSFNHQLGDEAVPVFIVHGSGDTLVPYEQAVDLCGTIDGSVLPVDVFDPLTVYQCGTESEVQIIKDAEHALELGVCVQPHCPAGEIGSLTRNAVADAINASYVWLQQDPQVNTDSDGDGVPDQEDAFPNDPNESVDTDGDGIGNNADTDDDNDGIPDQDEILAGTDPNSADTDGDAVQDGLDNCALITNPGQKDADHDAIGNACDPSNELALFDYNNDGKSDVLWRNSTTGQNSLLLMTGAAIDSSTGIITVPTDWKIASGGDYNSDGNADILWRNSVTGQNWLYLMTGAAISGSVGVNTVPTDWHIAGSGDYNGDGYADILWRNSVTGLNWLYLMIGGTINNSVGVNTVPTDWEVAGNGDYNGDGNADILWRNSITGQNWMYLMIGGTINSSVGVNSVGSPASWKVVGSSDYNGDGNSDILWRNVTTGQNWMYLMSGASIDSSVGVDTLSTEWSMAGSGDYNGDGNADILWRNGVTGQNRMYLMNGNSIILNQDVNVQANPDWQVVNPN